MANYLSSTANLSGLTSYTSAANEYLPTILDPSIFARPTNVLQLDTVSKKIDPLAKKAITLLKQSVTDDNDNIYTGIDSYGGGASTGSDNS
ncbi:MAG: hypothetical protein ACFHU9_04015 [Fluviicola sp.]